jgi:hypothetical protein
MTTDYCCFYLQNRLIQTSQTVGQWYSDTSPFSFPWLYRPSFACFALTSNVFQNALAYLALRRITTFSKMGLSVILSINDTRHNNTWCKRWTPLCWVPLYWMSLFIFCYAECRYAEYRYAECRGTAYFTTAVSYDHKMFMKLIPDDEVFKTLFRRHWRVGKIS